MVRQLALVIVMVVAGGAMAQEREPAAMSTSAPARALVRQSETPLEFAGDFEAWWNGPAWSRAETVTVTHFTDESPHRPLTQARLLYDDSGLHLLWRVEDQYVLATRTEYQSAVYRDSTVEFFVAPKPERGYMNFETNCGGTALIALHDRTRLGDGVREHPKGHGLFPLPWELGQKVKLVGSLPATVDPEIKEPVTWFLYVMIPWEVLESQFGPLRPVAGQVWRANFYKIAKDNSHPHEGTWNPVPPPESGPRFHQPVHFGELAFE